MISLYLCMLKQADLFIVQPARSNASYEVKAKN